MEFWHNVFVKSLLWKGTPAVGPVFRARNLLKPLVSVTLFFVCARVTAFPAGSRLQSGCRPCKRTLQLSSKNSRLPFKRKHFVVSTSLRCITQRLVKKKNLLAGGFTALQHFKFFLLLFTAQTWAEITAPWVEMFWKWTVPSQWCSSDALTPHTSADSDTKGQSSAAVCCKMGFAAPTFDLKCVLSDFLSADVVTFMSRDKCVFCGIVAFYFYVILLFLPEGWHHTFCRNTFAATSLGASC